MGIYLYIWSPWLAWHRHAPPCLLYWNYPHWWGGQWWFGGQVLVRVSSGVSCTFHPMFQWIFQYIQYCSLAHHNYTYFVLYRVFILWWYKYVLDCSVALEVPRFHTYHRCSLYFHIGPAHMVWLHICCLRYLKGN